MSCLLDISGCGHGIDVKSWSEGGRSLVRDERDEIKYCGTLQ